MIGSLPIPELRQAIATRLRVVAPFLVPTGLPDPVEDPMQDAGAVIELCIRSVHENRTPERLWLLYTAFCGAYPPPHALTAGLRTFEIGSYRECWSWLLSAGLSERPSLRSLEIVENAVVVDVDATARYDLHTGIQQVIRKTVPEWNSKHEIVLAAWSESHAAHRKISDRERQRILHWDEYAKSKAKTSRTEADVKHLPLLVPIRSVVVVLDVAKSSALSRLSTMAQASSNRVVGVGYDCIPVVSGDLVPWGGGGLFARYLALVKHMRRIAGISSSATVEFQGFTKTLQAQGLAGPIVETCELAAESPAPKAVTRRPRSRPLILSVGSFEPRKNHLALLHAAEVLWREGHEFDLRLIGGMSWDEEVTARISELHRLGRPVDTWLRASAESLAESYEDARFTVFASLHEGYGLPVAESLAAGTPVITSNFGSTADIAAAGGAITVDPRNDASLITAMRQLLTDDELLNRLRSEIPDRPHRAWSTYADQLWDFLIEPELTQLIESTNEAQCIA